MITKDEIIAMAVSAGFSKGLAMRGVTRAIEDCYSAWPEEIEKFADLVATKERQRCQSVCEDVKDKSRNHLFRSGAAICAGVIGDVEMPDGRLWITRESGSSIRRGGNESRGTVPLHVQRSHAATIPLFTADQLRDYGDRRAAAERDAMMIARAK